MDFANQEAALVKFTIDLLGDADQRVSSRAQTLHGVGGGVCPDSVAHLRLHLLFIALEDHTERRQEVKKQPVFTRRPNEENLGQNRRFHSDE